jgi:transcriptional regulator with XRE-family HTH domain
MHSKKLKAIREARGIEQTVVAERLGVTKQMVSMMERGLRKINLDQFVEWCEALGVKPSAFWEDEER